MNEQKLNELSRSMEKMNKNNENLKNCPSTGGAPVNLLEVVDERTLINIVLEATTEVIDRGFLRQTSIPRWFTPASLLSLTCYGYLTCRYSSAEIAEGIRTDTALRYLSAKTFPDPSIFIKFRRANTEAIVKCVNIAIAKVREICEARVSENNQNSCDAAKPTCNLILDGDKRLGMAVMFDCLERDI